MHLTAQDSHHFALASLQHTDGDRHAIQMVTVTLYKVTRGIDMSCSTLCSSCRDGDSYIVNGHKWWTSGAPDPRCKISIFMGKTDPSAATHKQQSMILVPMDAPGVEILRPLNVYGYDDAPHGHAEVMYKVLLLPRPPCLTGSSTCCCRGRACALLEYDRMLFLVLIRLRMDQVMHGSSNACHAFCNVVPERRSGFLPVMPVATYVADHASGCNQCVLQTMLLVTISVCCRPCF